MVKNLKWVDVCNIFWRGDKENKRKRTTPSEEEKNLKEEKILYID